MAVESGVKFSVTEFVRHHFDSVAGAVRGAPLWVWPLPFIVAGAVLLLLQTPLAAMTSKPFHEAVGPSLTGLTAAAALVVHRKMRVFFSLLLACFAAAIFIREWHFWGTTQAVLVALAALAWWASSRREEILPYLRVPPVGGLLMGALWLYVVAQFLDQHFLLSMNLFSVNDYVRWNDNVEETLETTGHLMILAAVLFTWRRAGGRHAAG